MLHRWLTRRRTETAKGGSAPVRANGAEQLKAIRHLAVNEACASIEHAMRLGAHRQAEREIARALRIDPTSARLSELRAWHALDLQRPSEALDTLEAVPHRSHRLELLLQLVRMQAGQKALAHLTLNAWARQADCPDAALVLLACLDLDAGRIADARSVLTRRADLAAAPLAWRMLVLLELSRDLPQAARRAANAMLRRFGRRHYMRRFLRSLELDDELAAAEVPIAMIDQLAEELRHRPHVIRTLVVAQQCQPEKLRLELLRRAIGRIVDDLPEPIEGIEALALLAQLAGDHDEALRWAQRGIKLEPLNATLALLADHIEPKADRPLPDTAAALHRVAEAHPAYADVRRALVLRYHRRGMTASAHRMLERWLGEQQNHPLALRTQQELAA